MPTIVNFNGKQVIEAGAYTKTKGGTTDGSSPTASGTVLVIDTGLGAGYGGGAGVNGESRTGLDSVYPFTNLSDFRKWVRGGIFWDLAQFLFTPSGGVDGAERLYFIQARESKRAGLTMTFADGDIVLRTKAEGIGANGLQDTETTPVAADTNLESGFAVKFISGIVDPTKYIMQFYVGTYKGVDEENQYLSFAPSDSEPDLLVQSPEFATITEMATWMQANGQFADWFDFVSSTITTTGAFTAADLTTFANFTPFADATETYNATDIDDVLSSIDELDYTFVLTDKQGVTNGKGVENTKLFSHLVNDAVYEKFMVVGGGVDGSQFDQLGASSFDLAAYYNSVRAYVVHSAIKRAKIGGGFRTLSPLYHAAMVVGRLCGLEPQQPATRKIIGVDEPVHKLTLKERGRALLAGVMHLKTFNGNWLINQEINTISPNDQLIYPDGSSPEGSVMRISAALNREIKLRLEEQFVGQNAFIASPADVKAFVEKVLKENTAQGNTDSLIISSQNVRVSLTGTDMEVSYAFVPNSPVNRIFVTGVLLDISSSI